jgi:hypothetical protein
MKHIKLTAIVAVVAVFAYIALTSGNFKQYVASRVISTPAASSVHRCDVEAADPSDPLRHDIGKSDEQIVGIMATRACEEALAQFPDEPRFHFQYARALQAINRGDDAMQEFNKAVSLGNQPARYYVAHEQLATYKETLAEEHLENARKLLTEAAKDYPPAATTLQQITFTTDGWRHPQVMVALYNEDFKKFENSRILMVHFLNGMQKLFSSPLNPGGNECLVMVDATANYDIEMGIVGDPRNSVERALNQALLTGASWAGLIVLDPAMGGDPEKWMAFFEAAGEAEARKLANRYGCESPVTQRIYRGMLLFLRQKRPLSEYGADLLLHGKGLKVFLTPGETITGN